MKLRDLIKSVREKTLSKEALEGYRDELSHLFAEIMIECSDLEKEEAIFMDTKTDEQSVAEIKVKWKATPSGQRLIQLKRYALATKEILSSLRSRLYSVY